MVVTIEVRAYQMVQQVQCVNAILVGQDPTVPLLLVMEVQVVQATATVLPIWILPDASVMDPQSCHRLSPPLLLWLQTLDGQALTALSIPCLLAVRRIALPMAEDAATSLTAIPA